MPSVIIVTGLYKSGTSLVTQLIMEMNYQNLDDLYDDYVDGIHTRYLTYESRQLNLLNERIMQRMYGSDISHLPSWWRFHMANRIAAIWNPFSKDIMNVCGNKILLNLVLKDPRFCITLPWWVYALRPYTNLRLVWVLRDVTRTARSWLNDSWCRSALKIDTYTRALWLASGYNLYLMRQFLEFSPNIPSFVFNLEDVRNYPETQIEHLAEFAGFEGDVAQIKALVRG